MPISLLNAFSPVGLIRRSNAMRTLPYKTVWVLLMHALFIICIVAAVTTFFEIIRLVYVTYRVASTDLIWLEFPSDAIVQIIQDAALAIIAFALQFLLAYQYEMRETLGLDKTTDSSPTDPKA